VKLTRKTDPATAWSMWIGMAAAGSPRCGAVLTFFSFPPSSGMQLTRGSYDLREGALKGLITFRNPDHENWNVETFFDVSKCHSK